MRILFIADGRSQIALNWMRYFVESEHEVHLVSLYPGEPDLEFDSFTYIPVAFSGAVEQGSKGAGGSGSLLKKLATPQVRTWLRHHFIPRSLPAAASQLQSLISNLQPDLIHAMRIPYEGMLAAVALSLTPDAPSPPLLISVWGNDFTLHAPATRRLTKLTRQTMKFADALHTDCVRDLGLAGEWGFSNEKPGVVLPGAGGIQKEIFFPNEEAIEKIVINPRGMRAYVQNETFFKAIPLILESQPNVQFICPAMQNQPEAVVWVSRLGAGKSLQLLPHLTRIQMAEAFRRSQIVLSITTHDGTPNTLLEALACGCFPIVGNIESLREWITHGENGLLVDPKDPKGLADAILRALQDDALRVRAREQNLKLIAERAEYSKVMGDAEEFYQGLI
ncbi:MAG: glycosyltransferase family 4 protein [Anaerolineales bacterium]|nr:glycosyltransferase family 4 protein [Chloroflexota bacterium]MBL6982980.1 glycosyltransferase family 4 protein [Anaerolineales bacterium]